MLGVAGRMALRAPAVSVSAGIIPAPDPGNGIATLAGTLAVAQTGDEIVTAGGGGCLADAVAIFGGADALVMLLGRLAAHRPVGKVLEPAHELVAVGEVGRDVRKLARNGPAHICIEGVLPSVSSGGRLGCPRYGCRSPRRRRGGARGGFRRRGKRRRVGELCRRRFRSRRASPRRGGAYFRSLNWASSMMKRKYWWPASPLSAFQSLSVPVTSMAGSEKGTGPSALTRTRTTSSAEGGTQK